MISHMVRMMILNDFAQVVWQGLVSHQWNDSELQRFQQFADRVQVFSDHQRAVRFERAVVNTAYDQSQSAPSPLYASVKLLYALEGKDFPYGVFRFLPQTALLYRNQLRYNEWLEDIVFPSVDEGFETVHPEITAHLGELTNSTSTTPYNFFAKSSMPIYYNFIRRSATTHVLLREAGTACAIERFRLENGDYPEKLSALVPSFLLAERRDPFTTLPFQYHKTQDGSYLIYSVGWNGTDEGGTVNLKASNKAKRDDDASDWVWFGNAR
jgi:hypothetical protein